HNNGFDRRARQSKPLKHKKKKQLQEDRIMDLIAEHGILSLLIRNLSQYHTFYSPGCLFFHFSPFFWPS
ncbi:MAG: hypothetical protein ACK55Z_15815, partial [bacterium]